MGWKCGVSPVCTGNTRRNIKEKDPRSSKQLRVPVKNSGKRWKDIKINANEI